MQSSRQWRGAERSASDEVVDEALCRSSPRAWLSGLILAVTLVGGLWFGDFVSEHTAPAWELIERDIASIPKGIGIDPGAATLGSAADALLMR
jgi:hypothetical protein